MMTGDVWFWFLAGLAALLVGSSKGGLPLVGMLAVPLVALQISPVVAAGLVLATLLAGIAGTTIGLVRTEQARSDEADQRKIAEEKQMPLKAVMEEARTAFSRRGAESAE